jgi:menaquinone-specific isochorismate synthase
MLASAMEYRTITEQYGRLVSLSRPAPGLSLRAFLRTAQGHERFYWENTHDPVAFAGMGIAVELTAWGAERFHKIEQRARELFDSAYVEDGGQPAARPRLFGGFAFRDDFAPDNTWAVFAPAQFILPHFQLTQVGGNTWLTMNAHLWTTCCRNFTAHWMSGTRCYLLIPTPTPPHGYGEGLTGGVM